MSDTIDNDFGMKCPKCGASDEIDIAATVAPYATHSSGAVPDHTALSAGQFTLTVGGGSVPAK